MVINSASLFGLPLTTIVFCYLSILRTTRRRSYVTSRRHFERELKVSCTILILIGLFIICWAPFFIITIISATCFCINMTLVLYFKALHFGTSCVNPIVYAARIPDFREAFAKMLPKQVISFVVFLLNRKRRESPPSSRIRTLSTLSSTIQSVDPSKRRPTLLENKMAVDQLSSTPAARDSSHASSVNSNKYVAFLSDSPSSPPNVHLTKV